MVLRIPCVFFLTTKKNGQEMRHLGWLPYELLDEKLRTRLTRLYLPGPHAPDRARRIQALKGEVFRIWIIAGTSRPAGLSYISSLINSSS